MYNFKKCNGEDIDNILDYINDYIKRDPNITITVGCDYIQGRRRTTYAIAIMFYDRFEKNGAHVVYYREIIKKIKNIEERLYKEVEYVYNLATYLDENLKSYNRMDIDEYERKKYKFHLLKCAGEYSNVAKFDEQAIIDNLYLSPTDLIDFKLVDIHVDFNPFEGKLSNKGNKNKSYIAYKSYVPWLRSLGFRTWSKPESHCASSMADYLLK